MAYLTIKILNGKNLPVMKKLTKSADAYCEVTLSNCHVGEGKLIQRTSTVWEDLFPKWNEAMSFKRLRLLILNFVNDIMHVYDLFSFITMTIVNEDVLTYMVINYYFLYLACSQINEAYVVFNIHDATKRPTGEDAMIGYCDLPVGSLLDQKRHIFVIALNMPEKRSKSLPIMIDGSLRVEAKLFYSRSLLLQQRISDLEQQISECQERRDAEIFNDESGTVGDRDDRFSSTASSKSALRNTTTGRGEGRSGNVDRRMMKSSSQLSSSSTSNSGHSAAKAPAPTSKSLKNAALKAKLQQEAAIAAATVAAAIKRPGKVRAIR